MTDSEVIIGIDQKVNEVLEQVLDINNTVNCQEAKRSQRDKEELEEARKIIYSMKAEQERIQKRLRRDDLLEFAQKIARGGKPPHLAYPEGTLGWGFNHFFSTRDEIWIGSFNWCIITDKAVYQQHSNKIPSTGGTHLLSQPLHHMSADWKGMIRPLYTFNEPLTLLSADVLAYDRSNQALQSRDFEDLVRTIPGSYQNGGWKQLSGFWGTYLNHETRQVSVDPPPLE